MQYFFLSPLGCRHALSAVSIKSATVLSRITRQLVTEVKKNNTGAMLDCCLAPDFFCATWYNARFKKTKTNKKQHFSLQAPYKKVKNDFVIETGLIS